MCLAHKNNPTISSTNKIVVGTVMIDVEFDRENYNSISVIAIGK
jgi:hypothetical protein